VWTVSFGSGQGPAESSCEHDNEPLGSSKRRGISSLAEQLSASQQGLYSMELVGWLVGTKYCLSNNLRWLHKRVLWQCDIYLQLGI
jgi:hypothetical protein